MHEVRLRREAQRGTVALDPERRYVVHVFHVLTLLITTASLFWAFWSFREVAWNYPLSMSALLGPATVYYLACTLVPDSPSSVASWRAHYYAVRKRYFLGICAWSVVLSLFISLGAGLIFGVYPARRAAQMNPIEALRHE